MKASASFRPGRSQVTSRHLRLRGGSQCPTGSSTDRTLWPLGVRTPRSVGLVFPETLRGDSDATDGPSWVGDDLGGRG